MVYQTPWLSRPNPDPTSSGSFSQEGYTDYIGGVPLPDCPADNTFEWFSYPTVVFTYIILSLVCFIIAIVTMVKYNSVRVFNRKIRSAEISNTLWILFYLALGARALFDALRYGMDLVGEDSRSNAGLFLASIVLDGMSILCLNLAINHQRKYRSTAASAATKHADAPVEANARMEWLKTIFTSLETLFFLLFLIYLVCFFLTVTDETDDGAFYWLFIAANVLNRVPAVALTIMIVMQRSLADGPTTASKNALLIGTLFHMTMVLPPSIWASIFPADCPLYFASWVDLLQFIHILSLFLYFYFLRAEYQRNMEECIWMTVSQIQDTFDFRRF